MGDLLTERLGELNSPHITDVRGLGLMVGVEMDMDVTPLINAGHAHGLLMINAGTNVLRLLPPLIVEETHIDEFIGNPANHSDGDCTCMTLIRHPYPDEVDAIRALFDDEVRAGKMLPRSSEVDPVAPGRLADR